MNTRLKSLTIAATAVAACGLVATPAGAAPATSTPSSGAADAAAAPGHVAMDGVRLSITNGTDRDMTVAGATVEPGETSVVKSSNPLYVARATLAVTLPNGNSGSVSAMNHMVSRSAFDMIIAGQYHEVPVDEDASVTTSLKHVGTVKLTCVTTPGWRQMNMTVLPGR